MKSLLRNLSISAYERVIILSPHMDDAAISCGGLLTRLKDYGSTLVINIFAGNPEPRDWLKGDKRGKIRRSFTSPQRRRMEDKRALTSINCDYVHLGFCDSIYRRDRVTRALLYRQFKNIWQPPSKEDISAIQEVYAVVEKLCTNLGAVLVISPLGIGYHVDHLICANVGLKLMKSGLRVVFVEDFPYSVASVYPGLVDNAQSAMMRLGCEPGDRFYLRYDLQDKVDLITYYQTQIFPVFGGLNKVRYLLKQQIIDRKPVEFYWEIKEKENHEPPYVK
jgi:LmbE family N-acetylglucosaminyl deacetylase